MLEYKVKCMSCGSAFVTPPGDLDCPHCGTILRGWASAEMIAKGVCVNAPAPEPEAPPEEAAAPPPGLDDLIGNVSAVMQIRVALEAHRARKAKGLATVFPHTLLVGPAGSGKSTLSGIIARECKHKLHEHLGQSMNDPRAMVSALQALKSGDVFYIDEIHGLKKTCMETLYGAMQERQVVPISSRTTGPLPPVKLPAFTLIGATTDQYKLTDSFKQRFQYQIALRRMTVEELSGAVAQRSERGGVKLDASAAKMIAERSHGTPRKAVMLLARCLDMALAFNGEIIDTGVVEGACAMAELDGLGLTQEARSYLRVLADSAKPVRLNVLASMLAVPPRVVEVEIERDLIYLHLIEKRENGRFLSEAGRAHLHSQVEVG